MISEEPPRESQEFKSLGFTLIELIVVLAGLGILSSLTIPNFLKYLDYAKVDEVKSLLNATAADCLQGLRRDTNRLSNPIDENLLSYARLKSTGYVFKDGTERASEEGYLPNCASVQITAALENDRKARLPDLGFVLNEQGVLTKLATNSGSDTKFPAESWAGANTTDEKTLVEWLKLNEEISNARLACKTNQEKFAKNIGTGQTSIWDSNKTSSCTDKPPKSENPSTCTPDGCTKPIWYIDGEVCGYSPDEFRACKDAKRSAACKAEEDKMASKKPPWTTTTIAGDQLPNCDEPVWYFEGNDMGSAEAWQKQMCAKNIKIKEDEKYTDFEAPSQIEHCFLDDGSPKQFYFCDGQDLKESDRHTICLESKESEKCELDIREKRESGHKGEYTNQAQGPLPCGQTYWFCDKRQYTKESYLETICANPPCTPINPTLCSLIPESYFCKCAN